MGFRFGVLRMEDLDAEFAGVGILGSATQDIVSHSANPLIGSDRVLQSCCGTTVLCRICEQFPSPSFLPRVVPLSAPLNLLEGLGQRIKFRGLGFRA